MHLVEFPHPLALWDTPITVLVITVNHYYYWSDQKKKGRQDQALVLAVVMRRGWDSRPQGPINTGAQFVPTVIFQTRTPWSATRLPYGSRNNPWHSLALAACWGAPRRDGSWPAILRGCNTRQGVPALYFPCPGPTCSKTPPSLISSEFSSTSSWEPTVSHTASANLWGWEWPGLREITF